MGIQERFYELVSGQKTDLTAMALRGALRLLEIPYRSVISARNLLYDKRVLPIHRSSVPIISVGNLTLGGTGKSPMVVWLCKFFLEKHLRPGLISRGYGRGHGGGTHQGNDEFMEMSHRLPNIPHLQHPKRADAIQKLLQTEQVDLIILDDAFQHRQVERDIDIVLLDATAPFGFGHVFPRGTLREPLGSLKRADIALLTRSNLITEAERQKIRSQVWAINPNITWGETIHMPTSLVSLESLCDEPLETISGQSALAFCGIGNPSAFQRTLEQCGVRVEKLIPFPDHYRYTAGDACELVRAAKELGTNLLLCTMKDLVKLNRQDFSEFSLYALAVEIQFTVGVADVEKRVGVLTPGT